MGHVRRRAANLRPRSHVLRTLGSGEVEAHAAPSSGVYAIDPNGDALVCDIMARDVWCAQPTLFGSALARHFADGCLRAVPVVDDERRPIGVIGRSALVALLANGSDPARMTVADIMTPLALSLPPNIRVSRAAAVMAYEGVHTLPVVDDGGRLIGVVSALDVLGSVGRSFGFVVPRWNAS